MSVFPEHLDRLSQEAWSVSVLFAVPPSEQGNPSYGEAEFLMQGAPRNWLRPGVVFELYEGNRLTAVVEVLPDRSRTAEIAPL